MAMTVDELHHEVLGHLDGDDALWALDELTDMARKAEKLSALIIEQEGQYREERKTILGQLEVLQRGLEDNNRLIEHARDVIDRLPDG